MVAFWYIRRQDWYQPEIYRLIHLQMPPESLARLGDAFRQTLQCVGVCVTYDDQVVLGSVYTTKWLLKQLELQGVRSYVDCTDQVSSEEDCEALWRSS